MSDKTYFLTITAGYQFDNKEQADKIKQDIEERDKEVFVKILEVD